MNSTRTSQVWLKTTTRFSVSPTHSCLCGAVVSILDCLSVGWWQVGVLILQGLDICFTFLYIFPHLISWIQQISDRKQEKFKYQAGNNDDGINQIHQLHPNKAECELFKDQTPPILECEKDSKQFVSDSDNPQIEMYGTRPQWSSG